MGGTEITNLIQDFKASGATMRTNTGLVNWLLGGTQETGTDGNYYYKSADKRFVRGGLDFRPTKNSPVVDAGENLGTAYELDINGVNQNNFGSGWEIGAHVYQGYAVYGLDQPGSYFKLGTGATVCGPPLYACSSISSAVVQTPNTPPISSASSTGTTCTAGAANGSGNGCYNSIGYDTSINPSGVDPMLRASDGTMLSGHSPSSTASGGDNDEGWSCTGRTDTSTACANATVYFLSATYGGCPFVEAIKIIGGLPTVVGPFPSVRRLIRRHAERSRLAIKIRLWHLCRGEAVAIRSFTQITYSWDGVVGDSPTFTQTALYDFGASCSVLPNGTSFNEGWSGPLSQDINDNVFAVSLSNVKGITLGTDTISVTNGSANFTVSGSAVLATDGSYANQVIKINSVVYTMASITSSTTGTLTTNMLARRAPVSVWLSRLDRVRESILRRLS